VNFRRAAALAIILIAAPFVTNARAGETVRGFTHEADISGSGEVVAIDFYPGVRIGSAPVVTNNAGKAVSSKVLLNKEHGQLILVFDGSGGGRFTLHYGGNGSAKRPAKYWDPTPSLLMEVRTKRKGAVGNWAAMKGLANSGEVQGMKFVSNVWHGYNPFGPSDSFVTIYRGELVIPKDGAYRFFTASSDDSYVFIDGKLAFSWPGVHGPWRGTKGLRGADMHLTKGKHKFEYYHAQVKGVPVTCLGWRHVGEEAARVVPAGFFSHTRVAQVSNMRRKDGGPTAHFNWVQGQLLMLDKWQFVRYALYSRSRGAKSIEWNFGDGVTTTQGNATHIFTGTPPFKVKLTARNGDKTDTCRINVPVMTPTSNVTINNRAAVRNFSNVIKTYPFEKIPAPILVRFFELVDTLESPTLLAPMAKALRKKLSSPASLMRRTKKIIAKAYLITDPKKAVPFLKDLTSSSDPTTVIEARIDLIETYLHRLRDFKKAKDQAEAYASITGKHTKLGRLARVKLGDIYLMQGDVAKAEEKYQEAQKLAFEEMAKDLREIAVRQGAHAEAVNSFISLNRFRAARVQLLEWEANFPISKITGDFILASSRYWEAIGDSRKALDDMESLLKINPITPYLPKIEYRMANAYRRLGEKEKARALYRKVVNEYPKNPVCHEAQRALNSLR